MNLNKTTLFIAISSMALVIVLAIQVNWIMETARIKEEIFNEKANLILAKTTEAIRSDKETCMKIGECVDENNPAEVTTRLGASEVHKIDSLFNHFMKIYNIHIEYSYVVAKPTTNNSLKKGDVSNYIYNIPESLIENENGFEIKLVFPEKRQYIIAEMGSLFITSVLLILIVLILFWRTVLSLLKEKKISEHTTEFLNNMTHEFKTPLTNIALAAKMMTKEINIQQQDKIRHYAGIILDENEKLELQVEHVLSMSALERGAIPLRKSDVDFHRLINDSVKYIGVQIDNRKGNLKIDLQAEHFVVPGDKTHLTNAFYNLIDNATKYSKDKPEILVQTFNDRGNLVVRISDKGIGIDKEYYKNVFDKFFRVPTGDVHNVKGFGLGLAYVKKIIELHGGKIELESEMGKGTTIAITLPNV